MLLTKDCPWSIVSGKPGLTHPRADVGISILVFSFRSEVDAEKVGAVKGSRSNKGG